jgi:hypothetical protein
LISALPAPTEPTTPTDPPEPLEPTLDERLREVITNQALTEDPSLGRVLQRRAFEWWLSLKLIPVKEMV